MKLNEFSKRSSLLPHHEEEEANDDMTIILIQLPLWKPEVEDGESVASCKLRAAIFAFNSSHFLVLEVEFTIVDGGRHGDGEQKSLLRYVNEW